MEHYFSKETSKESNIKTIEYKVNDKKFKFKTDNAVFSKDKIDFASDLLIKGILEEDILEGKVLDVGCGYGTISVAVYKETLDITMIDVNLRAMNLAKENLEINGAVAKVIESDAYENVEGKYNFIITNPPIRAGKKKVHEILIGAYEYLEDDGVLYFVMNKKHGFDSAKKKLEELFDIQILNRKDGFRVVRCNKKKEN